jgi:hypothetical protein
MTLSISALHAKLAMSGSVRGVARPNQGLSPTARNVLAAAKDTRTARRVAS